MAKDAGPPSPGPQHNDRRDHHAQPHRHVTTHYRYKRPPRKRKAVPLEGPAICTPRWKAAPAIVQRDVKPGNDNRPAEEPAAIVTIRKPRGRKAAWVDDGAETVKAFLARMVRPGGSLPPGGSE